MAISVLRVNSLFNIYVIDFTIKYKIIYIREVIKINKDTFEITFNNMNSI